MFKCTTCNTTCSTVNKENNNNNKNLVNETDYENSIESSILMDLIGLCVCVLIETQLIAIYE